VNEPAEADGVELGNVTMIDADEEARNADPPRRKAAIAINPRFISPPPSGFHDVGHAPIL
jgi:hypothetical protein